MSYSVSLGMYQGQNQSLKQNQRLMMSPQMQQAIHLLQVPVLELEAVIEAELEQNPILEYDEETFNEDSGENTSDSEMDEETEYEMDFNEQSFEVLNRLDEEFQDLFYQNEVNVRKNNRDEEQLRTFLESSIRNESTLSEILMDQSRSTFESTEELYAAEILIGSLDERGFLTSSTEELSALYEIPLLLMEEVLTEIQEFEPAGVGASNEQESLLIQLRRKGRSKSLAFRIVKEHYEDLLRNRIPLIAKALKVKNQEVCQLINDEILPLELRPGVDMNSEPTQYIKADVHIVEENGKLRAFVQEDALPPLRLSPIYLKMLEKNSVDEETKEYIKQKVASSRWLLRNIRQRNETLLRIANCLIEKQTEYFLDLEGKLRPMTMKMVAEDLELHESTIARAVSNKYLNCSKGLVLLRSFFTHAYNAESGEDVSSRTVKDILIHIIQTEDKNKPLSDEIISKQIQGKGIPCARRTVAKYRKELKIGNTSQRRVYV